MITLFRRIREKLIKSGSLTKYLLYAIGEILLVVIGILIALQVNNWNEERRDSDLESNYLTLLKEELQNNADFIQRFYLDRYERKASALNMVRDHYQGTYAIEDSLAYALEVGYGAVFSTQAIISNAAVYQEIISTGNLTVISDEDLRYQLMQYYSLMDSYMTGLKEYKSGYLLKVNSLRPFSYEYPDRIDPFDMRLLIRQTNTEEFYLMANGELSYADQAINFVTDLKNRAEQIIIRIDEVQDTG
ncbi:DUF6090 family protein [Balneola sp. MJW-20]|uniref:DUF6090 family protein n=1 Tax=Gracilimonas aurantiaca TaxID=3234185 RepID=UPI003467D47E